MLLRKFLHLPLSTRCNSVSSNLLFFFFNAHNRYFLSHLLECQRAISFIHCICSIKTVYIFISYSICKYLFSVVSYPELEINFLFASINFGFIRFFNYCVVNLILHWYVALLSLSKRSHAFSCTHACAHLLTNTYTEVFL